MKKVFLLLAVGAGLLYWHRPKSTYQNVLASAAKKRLATIESLMRVIGTQLDDKRISSTQRQVLKAELEAHQLTHMAIRLSSVRLSQQRA